MVEIHPETNRSWSRGRDQYRSDSGQRHRNRSNSRNRSWSRGRDRRDRSYDRQYRGIDRSRDYYRDSRDYRDRDYRDSRSNRGDISRGNNRKGYNGYNNRRSNHCAGCTCNQSYRIEVILMAEETQEEILHVLMLVFSLCKTP